MNNNNTNIDKQRLIQLEKLNKINKNPVLWAKAFVKTIDNKTKKVGPWTARWYQAEMLLDQSLKKVARCGRRTGKNYFAFATLINCWEVIQH